MSTTQAIGNFGLLLRFFEGGYPAFNPTFPPSKAQTQGASAEGFLDALPRGRSCRELPAAAPPFLHPECLMLSLDDPEDVSRDARCSLFDIFLLPCSAGTRCGQALAPQLSCLPVRAIHARNKIHLLCRQRSAPPAVLIVFVLSFSPKLKPRRLLGRAF